ncbi:MAG: hypothetical protein PHH49_04925 [Candidatus Omnitrophica bacterium]|nr:hypothetical protein [Candidatus Omnitrophota bacterium]MDD5488288.1 hypothetical protein [Candidatus Omnitrophota bacterium]
MRGHVISKIREASYFLRQMGACSEKPEEFRFNLSAFLTSSRSTAQYLLEEARRRQKERWYESYISNTQYMGYFRDKRNFNIHEQSVPITRDVNLTISIIGTKLVVDKKEKKYFTPSKKAEKVNPNTKTSKFEFTDYPGKEDILTLSTKYLEELKKFVVDAQNDNVI